MQPLHIQLSLFSQYLKKATAKELFSEASIAQANGERIFGLRIPYLLDGISIKSNKSFTSINTTLGYYQWEYDLLTLYHKRIEALSQKYHVDYKQLFTFCFCHEVGHAKQQRLFESIGYFPNKFKIWPEGVAVEIESTKYLVTEKFPVSSKPFWDAFSCYIQDFAINKVLLQNAMQNELCRPMAFDISAPAISNDVPRQFIVLESLAMLPHDIDVYEHGGLLQDEKRLFVESKKKILGDKWDIAYALLRKIEFAHPESILEVTIKMFKDILGVHASFGYSPQRRSFLFKDYSTVPKYWNKDSYEVLFLM